MLQLDLKLLILGQKLDSGTTFPPSSVIFCLDNQLTRKVSITSEGILKFNLRPHHTKDAQMEPVNSTA